MSYQQLTIIKNHRVVTRDGVTLYADSYRSAEEGCFPVVLVCMPYSKDAACLHLMLDALRLFHAGYVVVMQDTRSTDQSHGDFYAFAADQEIEDGSDTINWIARRDWSDGTVGFSPDKANPDGSPALGTDFDPEQAKSWELGLRSRPMEDRFRVGPTV